MQRVKYRVQMDTIFRAISRQPSSGHVGPLIFDMHKRRQVPGVASSSLGVALLTPPAMRREPRYVQRTYQDSEFENRIQAAILSVQEGAYANLREVARKENVVFR